jgi:Bacterial Ig domain/Fibronectin type III domain
VIYRTEAFFGSARTTACSFIAGALFAILQLPAFAAGSVTLAWNPSTDTNVVGYNIYFGGASETYTNKISVATGTNAVVSGLVEGATYYFAATAYDSTGMESPFSNEASYSVPLSVIPVNPVNKPPTLNVIGNLAINENTGTQTVNLNGISSGATNEIQTLTMTAVSSNPALIPTPTVNYSSANTTGTLAFAPAQNATGTATITVTVNDGQTTNNTVTRTFTITVNAVNQPPTINPIGNFFLTENAGTQTVDLNGITSGIVIGKQRIKITASSSNRALFRTPAVHYASPKSTGTMTFRPLRNAVGTTTVTVTVNNGAKSNNIFKLTFTVTVLAKGTGMPATMEPTDHGGGQFALSVAGSSGVNYVVEASTNLVDWVPVWTNMPPFTYTDFNAGQFSQRYYRSIPVP